MRYAIVGAGDFNGPYNGYPTNFNLRKKPAAGGRGRLGQTLTFFFLKIKLRNSRMFITTKKTAMMPNVI